MPVAGRLVDRFGPMLVCVSGPLLAIAWSINSMADAVEKALELERNKVNVNGAAIALGHPLGATGTRLVMTILYELRRSKRRYGLAGACIGGGQGIAIILEAL